ncbi:MAG TPA: hypothetical protein DD723_09590 [Candidatus Omnitrophica bacterium]|nr:MAG: hypothetical protein A2Z81_02980 [Omnitrophica WOR_2 bacterium GWA2_45_18]OGX19023.1 MAG: hypothetical protein A2Y04_00710 [Omnitrophica WOR_2 bacterium GWC2_45_7]HBR15770.1 hypothetical protein [Candidatus Omnitrophota bacterium]
MHITAEIAGWIGMVLFLLAYILVTFKKIEVTGRAYQSLNLFGALALGTNVFYEKVWPALVLEIVWGAIAVVALVRRR